MITTRARCGVAVIADPRRDDDVLRMALADLELLAGQGYEVALLPWASRLRGAVPHSAASTQRARSVRLWRPDRPLDADLVIVHDLEVFRQTQDFVPALRSRRAVLALDVAALTGPASDGSSPTAHDVAVAIAAAGRILPCAWTVHPLGAASREWFVRWLPDIRLGDEWPSSLDEPDRFTRAIAALAPAADDHDDTEPAPAAGNLDDTAPTSGAPSAAPRGRSIGQDPSAWRIGPLGRDAAARTTSRVLFFTDNGHGLGHLTRLMAIARRLPPHVAPVFLTLSEAHPIVRRTGFPVEHLPSRHRLGIELAPWEAMARLRLERFIERIRPAVLVIDHGKPPEALIRIASRAGVRLVWSRRGLWRRGHNRDALRLEGHFDVVVEPGDLAAALDRGATRARRDVQRVRPITLVDRDDLLPRDRARHELGLPAKGAVLLLQLTADDAASVLELTRRAASQLSAGELTIFAPQHPLHDLAETAPGLVTRPVYPLARYLHAFDAAVSMAGYNSFHELLLAGVPSLFLARDTDSVDDQPARGRAAELAGAGRTAARLDDRLTDHVAELLDPSARARFAAAAERFYPGNGAADAAAIVADLAERTPG